MRVRAGERLNRTRLVWVLCRARSKVFWSGGKQSKSPAELKIGVAMSGLPSTHPHFCERYHKYLL